MANYEKVGYETCGHCQCSREAENYRCRDKGPTAECAVPINCFECRKLRFNCSLSGKDFCVATDMICQMGFFRPLIVTDVTLGALMKGRAGEMMRGSKTQK